MSALPGPRWQVHAARCVDYELRTVEDVFDASNDALLTAGRGAGSRRFVVVDEQILRYHRARIEAWFRQRGVTVRILGCQAGEAGKTVDAWLDIMRALEQFPIHRRDEPIIVIGGGVLTDVAGFAASSYRRGVPHIKVPTTLMGYVDAAIGIKTGINFGASKNRLGSFEPPRAVLLDRSLLVTLPPRHLRNGLCEIIKLGIIMDAGLFAMLEAHGPAALAAAFQDAQGRHILERAIDDMIGELSPNLYEDELARRVDFGHTFSYGLETHFETLLLHGEAVLLDMLVSTAIARRRGLLGRDAAGRIRALIRNLGIEPAIGLLDAELMWRTLEDRIEHRNGHQHVPLPTAIGRCRFVDDISRDDLADAIETVKAWDTSVHERTAQC